MPSDGLVIARRPIGRRKTPVLPDGLWADAAIQSSRALGSPGLLRPRGSSPRVLAMTALDQRDIILLRACRRAPAIMPEPLAAYRERRPPVRQPQAVYASKLFVVEAGIGRSERRGRVVGGRNPPDPGRAAPARRGLAENAFGEIRPGSLPGSGHVKDAP